MPTYAFPPKIIGGMDVYVYELSKRLPCEVIIPIPHFNYNKNIKTFANIKLVPIKCKKNKDISITLEEFNKKLQTQFKQEDYDIFHSNDWLFAESAYKSKKPWIQVIHSLELMRCVNINECYTKAKEIEDKLYKKATKIISVSKYMANYLKEQNNLKSKIIYNGFSLIKQKPTKQTKNILYVGRLTKQKGLHHLILAMKYINNAHLTIVGDGFLKEELKELTKNLSIEHKITFKGYIEYNKIKNIYKKSDIFVLPSIYEPFGIVITEAISYGLAVISTQNCGACELLEDKKDYLKIRPKNSKEIIHSITKLQTNPQYKKDISTNAQKKLKNKYSWLICAKKTYEIYKQVLSKE
jgi:glycogen synthase